MTIPEQFEALKREIAVIKDMVLHLFPGHKKLWCPVCVRYVWITEFDHLLTMCKNCAANPPKMTHRGRPVTPEQLLKEAPDAEPDA